MPEGEGKEQEIKNLFEQIMKENFTKAKEIDFQKAQKAKESQRNWTQEETHQGTS